MTLEYLTGADVLYIHHQVLVLWGGQDGLRSDEALQSCVNQPQQSFGGQDLYNNIYSKAAAYAYLLCQNHPFVDGNKRTAAFAMYVFLDSNGIELIASSDQLIELFFGIASSGTSIADVASWIQSHSIEIQ